MLDIENGNCGTENKGISIFLVMKGLILVMNE